MSTYVSHITNAAQNAVWEIQQGAVTVLDPLKRLFNDWDATSDAMKLYQRMSDIARMTIGAPVLNGLSASFDAFNEFTSAKSIFKRSYEILSGDGLYEKEDGSSGPICMNPNPLRMASKIASVIGDTCSSLKWLTSTQLIGKQISQLTARISVFGKSFKVMQSIQDLSGIASGVLSAPCNLSLLIESVQTLGLLGLLRRTYLFDLVQDITKVASIVLMNTPGVSAIYGIVTMAIGNTVALAKFIKNQYFKDAKRDNLDIKVAAAALNACEMESSEVSSSLESTNNAGGEIPQAHLEKLSDS